MLERRSLKLPIILGVTMIVLLVALTVGWILLTAFGAIANEDSWIIYIVLLSVGTLFLVFVLLGVVMYLTLSIKAINLTQRQSNFVDSVTHELKSPIASLKLYLQTLTRHAVDVEQRSDFYRVMLEDVERLDQLINNLLDAGRMERRSVDQELVDVQLADVLRQEAAAICLRYQVPAETIRLDLEPCLVHARRVDLEMIFRNLIDNAVKYASDDDPRVDVTLRPAPANWVQVLVGDNGRGIAAAHRRQIFGRFVRLGKELERDKPGTGLGLYIVRTLVSRLRGRVRVRDPDQGTGTVFEVLLRGNVPRTKSKPDTARDARPPAQVA
ncbi:MAG: HAMP domain-containing histidine kinase [Pirellulaceae bacterium]|nr:HAMP domain-containing histidine kinase [Pirellulaceae bacterium]